MDFEEWKIFYDAIRKDFGFSLVEDEKAACLLNSLLVDKEVEAAYRYVKSVVSGKDVVVCGAGPSLMETLSKNRDVVEKVPVIAADGATSALVEKGLLPDVVVTDLDGYVPDQLKVNEMGSVVVVHAHGDNIDLLKEYVPRFKGMVFGTTQCNPRGYDNLFNFGGFTDGDRAVFLVEHFGGKRVFLMGFDFHGGIGRFSFPDEKDVGVKKRKLMWCRRLLQRISRCEVVFL